MIFGLVAMASCGPSVKPMPKEFGPRFPVEGKVTLAGKLLRGGYVTFYALDHDTDKLSPHGIIDDKGHYFVESYQQKGAPAGKYRVTVDPGSDDKTMDRQVDPVYQNWQKSPLIVTVQENAPADAYDLKLDILKKKP